MDELSSWYFCPDSLTPLSFIPFPPDLVTYTDVCRIGVCVLGCFQSSHQQKLNLLVLITILIILKSKQFTLVYLVYYHMQKTAL